MKCKDCPYCWKGKNDNFPCCQYEGPEGTAPCEYEEPEEPEEPDYE